MGEFGKLINNDQYAIERAKTGKSSRNPKRPFPMQSWEFFFERKPWGNAPRQQESNINRRNKG
jgi:hypothetical protein